ncbi:MAG: regulatory iron-sulfur-containing complex subunit RicT, partial [Clostridia bacterium]|nr:regulatory iron-sulfur-containing complex subunit RicT [Clostridia bacterium]
KFKNTAKTYYFSPLEGEDYPIGSGVIVETAKGLEFGTIVFNVKEIPDENIVHPLKPIARKASEKDVESVKANEKKIPDTLKKVSEKIAARNLEMKLVGCEYSFDGKKLVIFFSAEGRVDFRELVKDLAAEFHVRIELRQIGIRDETKLLGGIAPCGRTCCCAGCIPDFSKVSIKMAKNQGLHLNPTKISGLCGRLMCCLSYEDEYYAEACKKVPKVGGRVKTPEGEAVVVSNDMLKMITKVKFEDSDGSMSYKDFPTERLEFRRGCPQQEKDEDSETEEISD